MQNAEFKYQMQHLCLDFNVSLAIEGILIEGVRETLTAFSEKLTLHIITGNTFGTASEQLKDIPCQLNLLPEKNQGIEKGKFVENLGNDSVISIGNGSNDHEMLRLSAIGIILLQSEGLSNKALSVSDIICNSIFDALTLSCHPKRMIATLRN